MVVPIEVVLMSEGWVGVKVVGADGQKRVVLIDDDDALVKKE